MPRGLISILKKPHRVRNPTSDSLQLPRKFLLGESFSFIFNPAYLTKIKILPTPDELDLILEPTFTFSAKFLSKY